MREPFISLIGGSGQRSQRLIKPGLFLLQKATQRCTHHQAIKAPGEGKTHIPRRAHYLGKGEGRKAMHPPPDIGTMMGMIVGCRA